MGRDLDREQARETRAFLLRHDPSAFLGALELRRERALEEAPLREWFRRTYAKEIDQLVVERLTNEILYGHPDGLEAEL